MRRIAALSALAILAPIALLSWLDFRATPAAALTTADIGLAAANAIGGLRAVVRRLASDKIAGRDNDTADSAKAQAMLIRRLKRIGPGLDSSKTGDDAYRQPFELSGEKGTNLLAIIPGRELPEEYVIIGAHYDHLDSRSNGSGRCSSGGNTGGAVCNGATDNAAGVAAVLAAGNAIRRLPTPPRRSIVLALWDAEEDGLLGSLYYVNHPIVPLADTVAYVNLDIQGANLLPSLRKTSFAIAAETGGKELQDIVTAVVGAQTLGTRQLSFIFGQLRSDYANFAAKQVPTVFFSDATGGCYHTTGDDYELVDFDKLRLQKRIVFQVSVMLAEAASRPTFVTPNAGLATYSDAVQLSAILRAGQADLSLFSAADQTLLENADSQLAAIVDDGPGKFDAADVAIMLNAAVETLASLARLGCQPF